MLSRAHIAASRAVSRQLLSENAGICDERGHDAREQTCIVNDTDADNTECENGGCYRRSEKRGEHGAHAAHRHDMHIFFIEVGYFAYQPRDAAAELKSRALTSGGAAEEVRYNS